MSIAMRSISIGCERVGSSEGPALVFVETDSLTKRYGAFTALDGCSLGVEAGEVFGLLGPNGAGKTTLLRLLLGFLRPSVGSARIDGLDCHRQSVQVRQRLAYLPGDVQLFRQMRGRDVLKFFAEVRPGGELRRSIELANRLELDLSRPVGYMSTGMRQKLALVATLAAATPLVVLDEPTSNLDPSVRAEVIKLVLEAKRAGRTVMFSSHVLSEVEEACDRVVILRQGRLVHTQGMSDLRRRHRITAELAGPLPPTPAHFEGQLDIHSNGNGAVTIETPGELSPLLGWLSTLPLREVRIEPVGLRAIYDQFHAEQRLGNAEAGK
jgi:ABC-2 type transport system ATP-binding protein